MIRDVINSSYLTQTERERWYVNRDNCTLGGVDMEHIIHHRSEAVGGGFIWAESPEGHDYWENISRRVCDTVTPMEPIKVLDKHIMI